MRHEPSVFPLAYQQETVRKVSCLNPLEALVLPLDFPLRKTWNLVSWIQPLVHLNHLDPKPFFSSTAVQTTNPNQSYHGLFQNQVQILAPSFSIFCNSVQLHFETNVKPRIYVPLMKAFFSIFDESLLSRNARNLSVLFSYILLIYIAIVVLIEQFNKLRYVLSFSFISLLMSNSGISSFYLLH